jgi:hypothetical protein
VAAQGAAPAVGAVVAGAGARGPAEEADAFVALRDEVFHGGVGACGAVDVDPVAGVDCAVRLARPARPVRAARPACPVFLVPGTAEGDERNAAPGQPRLPPVAVSGVAQHEPVDAVLAQQLLVRRQFTVPRRGIDGEEQQPVARGVRGLRQGVEETVQQDMAVPAGRYPEADEAAGAGTEGTGGAVRAVAHVVHRAAHPLQGLGTQQLRGVEGVRHGLRRDARAARDHRHRHRAPFGGGGGAVGPGGGHQVNSLVSGVKKPLDGLARVELDRSKAERLRLDGDDCQDS